VTKVPASKPFLELSVMLTVQAVRAMVHQPAQLELQHLAVVVCYSSFLAALDDAGRCALGGTHRLPLPSIHSIVVKKFRQLHAAALQPGVSEPPGEFRVSQSCPTFQLA